MINANGLYQVDETSGENVIVPKVKTTLIHVSLEHIHELR